MTNDSKFKWITITSFSPLFVPIKTWGSEATNTSHKFVTLENWQSRYKASTTRHTNRRTVRSGQASSSVSSHHTGRPVPSKSKTSNTLSAGHVSTKGTVTPPRLPRLSALSSVFIKVSSRCRNGSPQCSLTIQSSR